MSGRLLLTIGVSFVLQLNSASGESVQAPSKLDPPDTFFQPDAEPVRCVVLSAVSRRHTTEPFVKLPGFRCVLGQVNEVVRRRFKIVIPARQGWRSQDYDRTLSFLYYVTMDEIEAVSQFHTWKP